jgi:hypothetical protein
MLTREEPARQPVLSFSGTVTANFYRPILPLLMKPFTLSTLLLGLALTFTAVGCQDDDPETNPTPAQATGAITGTISPAGAITTVTATSSGGLTYPVTPTAAGGFSWASLPAGAYMLSFTPAPGYTTPAARTLTLSGGQTVDAGTVTAASDGSIKGGTVTWTADGSSYSSTSVSGRLVGSSFALTTQNVAGNVVSQLQLNIPSGVFTGPGLYQLGVLTGGLVSAAYLRTTNGLVTAQYGNIGSQAATGTINVTAYDAAAGTVSGTFGFVARPLAGTTGPDLTVSNGSFTLRF